MAAGNVDGSCVTADASTRSKLDGGASVGGSGTFNADSKKVKDAGSERVKAAIIDRCADELDTRQVSEDHLEVFIERERAFLARLATAKGVSKVGGVDCSGGYDPNVSRSLFGTTARTPRSSPSRTLALQYLMEVSTRSNARLDIWFQAAMILDEAVANWSEVPSDRATPKSPHEDSTQAHKALTTAAAAWLYCGKIEDADSSLAPLGRKYPIDALVQLATSMSEARGGAQITREHVRIEETVLLMNTRSVGIATVFQWLEMITSRFDVVTAGTFGGIVLSAPPWATTLAIGSVFRAPVSVEHSPQNLAVGIFGLVLLAMEFLPSSTLMRADLELNWWNKALDYALSNIKTKAPSKGGSQLQTKGVIAASEFATGYSTTETSNCTAVALDVVLACAWQSQEQQSQLAQEQQQRHKLHVFQRARPVPD